MTFTNLDSDDFPYDEDRSLLIKQFHMDYMDFYLTHLQVKPLNRFQSFGVQMIATNSSIVPKIPLGSGSRKAET